MKTYSVGIDMIAVLQEANSDDATLEWDVDFSDREHSEMHTKLTRSIECLQRVSLSVNVLCCPAFPRLSDLSHRKFTRLCLSAQSTHTCVLLLICHGNVVWATGNL